MTDVILVRHGQTDMNLQPRFQGQVNPPLNATGLEQARRLGQRLASQNAQVLVVSDLLRTVQTAQAIAQAWTNPAGLPMTLDTGWREQHFGQADGLLLQDVQTRWPQQWAQWVQFREDFAFVGGESARQLHDRVIAALHRCVTAHPQQTLVVVTHGGVLDMVYRHALGLPLTGPRQCDIPNTGLNHLRLEHGTLRIVRWADTAHLDDLGPSFDQAALAEPAKPSAA